MVRTKNWNGVVWGTFVALAAGFGLQAQTNLVTPAEWLAAQPKPNFAPGHHLPHLSKYGWPLPYELSVETASNWGYALDITSYSGLVNGGLERDLANSNSAPAKMVALCSQFPGKYVLSVNLDRCWPTNLSRGFWVTNSAGLFVDDKTNTWASLTNTAYTPIVSPEASLEDLQIEAGSIVAPLIKLNSLAPIGIILNGGERDLGVVGYDRKAWQFDPRVQNTAVFTNAYDYSTNRTGMSWPRYISNQKARHLSVLTEAVYAAVPNRELYVWYNTGNEQHRFHLPGYDWENEWSNWGWLSDVINTAVGIPSFEDYYVGASSFTNAAGTTWNNVTDLLTKHLNAVGFNILHGYTTNYTWVCGGWSTADTNKLADIARYTGFLKCLYTSGTVGANAGYYSYPIAQTDSYLLGGPGFDVSFPADQPPHWLLQIEALSRVHALFTHLEDYIFKGDLLPGDGNLINGVPHTNHFMSLDQPSYEFTNSQADANCRVLARKKAASDDWLICAWAAAGPDRTVSVNIPTLGSVEVLAASTGSIYRATTSTLTLVNDNGFQVKVPSPPPNFRVLTSSSP